MTPERKLEVLLGQVRPPARDPVFEARIMTRIARRRAWQAAASAIPGAIIATALAGGLSEIGVQVLAELRPAVVEVGAVALVSLAVLAVARRMGAPAPRV